MSPTRRWPNESDTTDALWIAIADPTRRRLLDALLTHGAASATTLAGKLPITRQAVVKHLAVLDRAGLVEAARKGREVRYDVCPERLDAATHSIAEVVARCDERRTDHTSTDRRPHDEDPPNRVGAGLGGSARGTAGEGEADDARA